MTLAGRLPGLSETPVTLAGRLPGLSKTLVTLAGRLPGLSKTLVTLAGGLPESPSRTSGPPQNPKAVGRTRQGGLIPRPKSGAYIFKSPVRPKGLRIQHRSDWIRPLPLAPIFPEAEAIPIYIGIDRMGMADARTHGGGPPEARR